MYFRNTSSVRRPVPEFSLVAFCRYWLMPLLLSNGNRTGFLQYMHRSEIVATWILTGQHVSLCCDLNTFNAIQRPDNFSRFKITLGLFLFIKPEEKMSDLESGTFPAVTGAGSRCWAPPAPLRSRDSPGPAAAGPCGVSPARGSGPRRGAGAVGGGAAAGAARCRRGARPRRARLSAPALLPPCGRQRPCAAPADRDGDPRPGRARLGEAGQPRQGTRPPGAGGGGRRGPGAAGRRRGPAHGGGGEHHHAAGAARRRGQRSFPPRALQGPQAALLQERRLLPAHQPRRQGGRRPGEERPAQ